MSQISLQSAFDRISATLQRDRSSGYDDLKRILRQSRGNTEYILSARIHHNQDIFEALAGQIDSERAAYLKSFKSTSRSAGASTGSRLASASAAHRLALEVCVRDLKWRKVREILAHLTETFSSDEQDPICEPLALDNAKAINEILAYRPHLEHVPSKEWKSLVKFALAQLELLAGQGSSDSAGRRLSGISNSSFALRTSRSQHSQTTKINSSLRKHLLAEFARLLRHLTSSSAAPIASHAPLVFPPLIETLQKAGVPGSTEVDLVAALNNVLTRSVTEAVTFIRNLTSTIVAIADALWARLPPRLIALKDELLSLIILLLPFIRTVTSHGTETSDVCQLVRNLADRLLKDYSSKAPKDLLGWDDLRLAPSLCNDNLHLPVFSLISSADESQRNWSTLILTVYLLDASSGDLVIGDGELPASPRRKRMRRESRYSQLVRTAREPGLSKSIAGLQLIAFYCQLIPLPEQELFDVVQFIIPLLSDEDLTVTSWASFTLSSCACQNSASCASLAGLWNEVWILSSRALNAASTCRIACHILTALFQLRLVSNHHYTELSTILRDTLAIHGPSTCDEASISLICTVLDFAQTTRPAMFEDLARAAQSWLFRTWDPGSPNPDMNRTLSVALELQDLFALLTTCLQKADMVYRAWLDKHTPLSETWTQHKSVQDQLSYVLQLDEQSYQTNFAQRKRAPRPVKTRSEGGESVSQQLLKNCQRHLLRMLDHWTAQMAQKVASVDVPMVKSTAMVLRVCNWISNLTHIDATILRTDQDALMSLLSKHLSSTDCHPSKVESALRVFLTTVSEPAKSDELETAVLMHSRWYSQIYSWIPSSETSEQSQTNFDDDDITMGNGSDFESTHRKASNANSRQASQSAPVFQTGELRSNACGRLYAKLFAGLADGGSDPFVPFIDEMQSMTADEIVAGREIILQIQVLGANLTESAAHSILDELFEPLLMKSYSQKCSEATMDLVLGFWSLSFDQWIYASNQDLKDLVLDVYENLLTVALPEKAIAPTAQKTLFDVLIKIWQHRDDFAQQVDNPPPSARSGLFDLISQSRLSTKYYIARHIPVIFEFFTPSNHDALFDDLQPKLPNDADWIEAIAMRISFLAALGSKWKSLLRKAVYFIFDAVGQVPACLGHAFRAISEIKKAHGFQDERAVFRLFCSQLVYTWQTDRSLSDMPYAVFGYESLRHLLEDSISEIVAQCLLFEKTDDFEMLKAVLETDELDLIRRSFASTLTYAIAHDVSHDKDQATHESSLRKFITDKELVSLVKGNLPYMVGKLLLSTHVDAALDRTLEKRSHMEYASQALTQMKTFASDTRQPAPALQPSFRIKHLFDGLERLARRAGLKFANLFDCSLFVAITRTILDSISNCLGSLHTRAVLHKLRLLCSLGDNTVTHRYPAEMLIRSLRPWLNDVQCADDAVGIIHHIYDRGRDTMSGNLSSLICSVFLTIDSIKLNAGAAIDVHGLNSQSQATRSNIQKLQTWLVGYAKQLDEKVTERYRPRYADLVQACGETQYPAEFSKASKASAYLLGLLDDARASNPIINDGDRNSIIKSLVSNSVGAPIGDDILQERSYASRYGPQIWTATNTISLSDEASQWLGRALGRSYSINGPAAARKLLTINEEESFGRDADYTTAILDSRSVVIKKLAHLLASSESDHASAAEIALRSVIEAFYAANKAEAVTSLMEDHIFEALDLPVIAVSKSRGQHATKKSSASTTALHSIGDFYSWIVTFTKQLVESSDAEPLMSPLLPVIDSVDGFAEEVLGPLCHLALSSSDNDGEQIRTWISETMKPVFTSRSSSQAKAMLSVLIYLLKQPLEKEATRLERLQWVEIDYMAAARSAVDCGLSKHALFLVEIAPKALQTSRSSRRSSSQISNGHVEVPHDLLLSIFDAIDDPDSFYAVERAASLDSILKRVDREDDQSKSLKLHSACLDATTRIGLMNDDGHSSSALSALSSMNLDSLTQSLLSRSRYDNGTSANTAMATARKLYEWDIELPDISGSPTSALFGVFQKLHNASTASTLQADMIEPMANTVRMLSVPATTITGTITVLHALAVMSDVQSLVDCTSSSSTAAFQRELTSLQAGWDIGQHNELMELISHQESMFGILRRNNSLQQDLKLGPKDALLLEAQAVLRTSEASRELGTKQGSLTAATYMTSLTTLCDQYGLQIESVANRELASVLWIQNEPDASVQILQSLASSDQPKQSIPVGRAGLLSQLGHEIAEARLEKPEDIIVNYLQPALNILTKSSTSEEAASVYFEFASFCDQQLLNSDNLRDFNHLKKLRDQKWHELEQLKELQKKVTTKDGKNEIQRTGKKTKQWFDIDNNEYQRMASARNDFIDQSLANYLRALQLSDKYNTCVVRFFALWLENDDSKRANAAVESVLDRVPSWKFVTLLNQIMSRLLDSGSTFQKLLANLVGRICADHPYHSIYQLFASSNSTVSTGDNAAQMRKSAASRIADELKSNKATGGLVQKVWEANSLYHALAGARVDNSRTSKFGLRQIREAYQMDKRVQELKIPPATLHLELRPHKDYHRVPTIVRFREEVAIASGISAPKILTARASDGKLYKQLFKGGNDDLRQDAIMEQVFSSVSSMLRNHTTTRRRNLHIRTYIVLPLSSTSGIIEFVPNSIPLHDVVVPAHQKYHPSDMKMSKAREIIRSAQEAPKDQRVSAFRSVTSKYSPVLRHFFFERFETPHLWFEKRLAYSRSTAAISILGHVLGLGDRHCHNILLDELSGEVIHIDLGVAFEAGRVLPVPEVVPFRLTRDIVDGMGISGVEGVFRRCCEFTLQALREEKDGIMTLLNVLRYDPLYSWTVSPLRARRMQDETGQEGRKAGEGASEAERALGVVEKKLSRSLSAKATVNELIQTAADERNLAVLFAGWAAYS